MNNNWVSMPKTPSRMVDTGNANGVRSGLGSISVRAEGERDIKENGGVSSAWANVGAAVAPTNGGES